MQHPSLLTNYKKTLRKTKRLYHKLNDSENLQVIKALEFQSKLHTLIAQSVQQDPLECLKQMDIHDVPLELLQKWITQMGSVHAK